MLCQICKSAPASVHIQEFVNGKQAALHLCAECAQKRMLNGANLNSPRMMEILENLTKSIMGRNAGNAPMIGMIDIKGMQSQHNAQEQDLKCEACGYPFSQYKKTHFLHCEKCYDTFANDLERDFVLSNRGGVHVGHGPGALQDTHAVSMLSKRVQQECKLADLRKTLREMAIREEYELAAQIKDEISKLEQSLNSLPFADDVID